MRLAHSGRRPSPHRTLSYSFISSSRCRGERERARIDDVVRARENERIYEKHNSKLCNGKIHIFILCASLFFGESSKENFMIL